MTGEMRGYEESIEAGKAAVAAGDIAAANEIAAYLDANFPEQASPTPPEATDTPLSDRLEQAYNQTVLKTSDKLSRIDEGLGQGAVNTQDVLMQGLSGGVQLTGQAAIEVGKTLWNKIPEASRVPVEQFMKTVGESAPLQAGLKAIESGFAAWDEFAKKNPAESAQLEAMVDVVSLLRPNVRLTSRKKKVDIGQTKLDSKREGVQKQLEPELNQGDGRWRETDDLNREAYYEPSPLETEMINRVEMDVPKFDPQRTARKNAEVTLDVVNKTREQLDRAVLKAGNNPIDVADTLDSLDEQIALMPDSVDGLALVGDQQAMVVAERLLQEGKRLISESDGTALGILNARREFDKLVRKAVGDSAFDASRIRGSSAAAKIIRDEMNLRVQDAVPNANVHDLLDKQHQLIKAHDILNGKAQKEAHNSFKRAMEHLKHADLVPSTALGVVASASAGGAMLTASPALATLALTAGGLYVGSKAVGIIKSRQIIGQTIQELDKLLKVTQSASDKALLRADRAALLEYLKSLKVDEDTSKGA